MLRFLSGVVIGLVLGAAVSAMAVTVHSYYTWNELRADPSETFKVGYVAGATDVYCPDQSETNGT
jgi:hypothetical protein